MAEIIEHETLAEALFYAQIDFPALPKDKQARIPTKSGGEYRYQYADLASTRKLMDPILRKHGLMIRDRNVVRDGAELLVSVITHISSKETDESEIDISTDGDMKTLGGNITYARRYNYWNLIGIVGEDDSEPRDLQRRSSSQHQGGQSGAGGQRRRPANTSSAPKVAGIQKEVYALERDILIAEGEGRTVSELRADVLGSDKPLETSSEAVMATYLELLKGRKDEMDNGSATTGNESSDSK